MGNGSTIAMPVTTSVSRVPESASDQTRKATVPIAVAVLIVNYRSADDTIRAINSFIDTDPQQQSFGDTHVSLDVLVLENGSADDSVAKLEQAFSTNPKVHLLTSQENLGFTGGNNLLIKQAERLGFEFVCLLNPDTTVINPAFFAELINELQRHQNLAAVGPRVYLRSTDRVQNTVFRFPWVHQRTKDWLANKLGKPTRRSGNTACDVQVLNGVCIMLRTKALTDIGGFDSLMFAYIDEADLFHRLSQFGWKARYLPVDAIVHHQRESGYHRGSNVEYLLKRNTLHFLLKHRRIVQAVCYTMITLAMLALLVMRSQVRRSGNAGPTWQWYKRLTYAFTQLWLGRASKVMGKPV